MPGLEIFKSFNDSNLVHILLSHVQPYRLRVDGGLAPGSYVYSWGLGNDADSLTLNIVDPNAVPEPDTLALVCGGVFSFLAFAAMRRRTAIARHR
jgi:hypothetical protein